MQELPLCKKNRTFFLRGRNNLRFARSYISISKVLLNIILLIYFLLLYYLLTGYLYVIAFDSKYPADHFYHINQLDSKLYHLII